MVVDHLDAISFSEVSIETHKGRNRLLLDALVYGVQKIRGRKFTEVPVPLDALLQMPRPSGQIRADLPSGHLGFIFSFKPHSAQPFIHRGVLETELGDYAGWVVSFALYRCGNSQPSRRAFGTCRRRGCRWRGSCGGNRGRSFCRARCSGARFGRFRRGGSGSATC